ncbi:hypothetical protein JMJ76_0001685 [Colletotrichum scovillei]|nr:hypothetical protein JMJ76_0001685 [Colletotrichum scovillei]KAG7078707.1 hypothetical protein JMJ78_0002375 [Colletotrichum scovillei]
MLADSIFTSWSDQAFRRGEISDPTHYRPSRTDFNEMAQSLFAAVGDQKPDFTDSFQASPSGGIMSGQQFELPGESLGELLGSLGTATETPERMSSDFTGLTTPCFTVSDENSRKTSLSSSVPISDGAMIQSDSVAADTSSWRKSDNQECQPPFDFPAYRPVMDAPIPMAPAPSDWLHPGADPMLTGLGNSLDMSSLNMPRETQSFYFPQPPSGQDPVASLLEAMDDFLEQYSRKQR